MPTLASRVRFSRCGGRSPCPQLWVPRFAAANWEVLTYVRPAAFHAAVILAVFEGCSVEMVVVLAWSVGRASIESLQAQPRNFGLRHQRYLTLRYCRGHVAPIRSTLDHLISTAAYSNPIQRNSLQVSIDISQLAFPVESVASTCAWKFRRAPAVVPAIPIMSPVFSNTEPSRPTSSSELLLELLHLPRQISTLHRESRDILLPAVLDISP
jgi:hypothetical protein